MELEAEVKGEFAGRGTGEGHRDWDVTSCVRSAPLFGQTRGKVLCMPSEHVQSVGFLSKDDPRQCGGGPHNHWEALRTKNRGFLEKRDSASRL